MENKKLEKKSVLKKLTIGIAAMALISCAFVGGTFARYTTGEKEIPGGVNVADWKIEVIEDAAAIFEFTPNMDAYATESGPRSKTVTEGGKILEIKNSGKVAATVTIKVDTASYVMEDKEGNPAQFPQYSVVDGEAVNAAWQNVSVDDIFTIHDLTVQYSGSTSVETVPEGTVKTYEITLKAGESVIVSIGEVVWTSDLTGENGAYGDLRDTWIGENISQIGYKMTWSAVQAEEIPVN